jgi:hypothetical protein
MKNASLCQGKGKVLNSENSLLGPYECAFIAFMQGFNSQVGCVLDSICKNHGKNAKGCILNNQTTISQAPKLFKFDTAQSDNLESPSPLAPYDPEQPLPDDKVERSVLSREVLNNSPNWYNLPTQPVYSPIYVSMEETFG